MGVTVAVARVGCNTSTGTQDITTTDLGGLTPKAAILIVSTGITDGSVVNHASLSVGATDGTNQWATTTLARNGQTTSDTWSRAATTRLLTQLSTSSGNLVADAAFDSFISEGIRINWTDASPNAYLLTVIFFAGTDLSVLAGTVDAVTPDQTETTVTTTFEPDTVFFAGVGLTSFGNTSTAGMYPQFGFANNDPGGIQQAVVAHNSVDNNSGAACEGAIYTDRIGAIVSGGSLSRSYELSAFTSSAFKVKVHGSTNQVFGYLALNFGGKAEAYVGTVASPTSTGNAAVTGVGFEPQAVVLAPSHLSSSATVQTSVTNVMATGLTAFTATAAFSTVVADEDASATTDSQAVSDNVPLILPLPNGTAGLSTTTYSLDSDGYTLNYGTVQASGRYMAVWAISVEITGTTYTQSAGGTLTTAGTIARKAQKVVAGTLTTSGAIIRKAKKIAAGTLTTAGSLIRKDKKVVAGTLTTAGALTAFRKFYKTLSGTLTSSGALTRKAKKVVAGTLTTGGALVKKTFKTFAGTLTSAGGLTSQTLQIFYQAVGGTLTTAGTLIRKGKKTLSGTLTSSGALIRKAKKIVAGTLTSSGALNRGIAAAAVALTIAARTALTFPNRLRAWAVGIRNTLTVRDK